MAVCFTALFTGCQKDDSPTTGQFINSNTTITKISFEEFKNHPKAFSEFEKLEGSREGFRPKSREYGDGYYYETEEVTLIEYNDERYSYKSYIFPMYRDTPTNSIENLLIWEKSTGETATLFFGYNLTEQDKEDFFNGKEIIDLDSKITVKSAPGDVWVAISTWRRPDGSCWTPVWQDPKNGTPKQPGGYWEKNVPCPQGDIDRSLGPNGGGGSTTTIYVYDIPFIPGSGNGGNGPVTDPNGPGGPATSTPVQFTPVINVIYQQFYSSLDNVDQRRELLSSSDLRNGIINLVNVLGPYQEEAFALAERIIDLSRAGFEEEALQILEYLNDGGENEIAEDMMESVSDGTAISLKPFFKYPQGSNYATLYPKLTEYLKNKVPQLRFNQFIIDKLEQYSELSVEQIKNDLQYGKGPEIHIAQLNSYGQNVYGIFDHDTPDILYVDVDFVNILENSQPGPQGNALAFLLGVTILHEYVHLGDFVDGNDQPGEEGILFEEATYGESIWIDNAERVLIKWEN